MLQHEQSQVNSNEKRITIIADQQTISRMVNITVSKRPVGWSRKSYSSYYNEEYAKALIPHLEKLMSDRQPKVFRIPQGRSLNTVYLWINNGFRFLCDFMDTPDKKYDKLRHATTTERVRGTGVVIRYKDVVAGELTSENFVERTEKVKWKKKIDDFLENDSDVKPLHIDNLILSPDEIKEINDELSGLDNIEFTVTSKEIKIVKIL